jgi:S-methylmethionine-dependent homocysteine/selenocysteine methylase
MRYLLSSFFFHSIPQENDPTLKGRVHQSDAREMQRFYREYYKKYIQALQNAADKADRLVASTLPLFRFAPSLFYFSTQLCSFTNSNVFLLLVQCSAH